MKDSSEYDQNLIFQEDSNITVSISEHDIQRGYNFTKRQIH